MPFESLSERIQMSLRRLTGRGKLNEKDIDDAMRAKCKLLGIETRVVLSYEIYVTRWCPFGTVVEQEISCSIWNHGDIGDDVLDAFKSRAVNLK